MRISAPVPIAVVTPLANEEQTIDEFLTRLSSQLLADDKAFCVFDETTTDGTLEYVRRYSETDSRIVAVWAPECRCVVDAYFAGYRAALNSDAAWIIEMDGGLSHRPEDIERFRAVIEREECDYVCGCRFMEGGGHRGNLKRKAISWGGSLAANLILKTQLKDMTGGYQGFSRDALQHVVEHGVKSRAHFFQTEIKFLLRNHRCQEIPIVYESPSNSVNRKVLWESILSLIHI